MKTVELQIPDGYKLEQTSEGKWEIVKEEEVTLEQILKKASHCQTIWTPYTRDRHLTVSKFKHVGQIKAMFELKCVADYLNDGWEPNWNNNEEKWHIAWWGSDENRLLIEWSCTYLTTGEVVFKTRALAEKAIAICGEELIKTALGIL